MWFSFKRGGGRGTFGGVCKVVTGFGGVVEVRVVRGGELGGLEGVFADLGPGGWALGVVCRERGASEREAEMTPPHRTAAFYGSD